jgi:hypothetical protein
LPAFYTNNQYRDAETIEGLTSNLRGVLHKQHPFLIIGIKVISTEDQEVIRNEKNQDILLYNAAWFY